jgi:uncharacterized protein (TIGR02266 family)
MVRMVVRRAVIEFLAPMEYRPIERHAIVSDDDDRRETFRAPIELKVEYKKLNTFFADYTKNICKGGTFIRTKKPLDVGTIFVFQLGVPKLKEPIAIRGEVKCRPPASPPITSRAWASASSTRRPKSARRWRTWWSA